MKLKRIKPGDYKGTGHVLKDGIKIPVSIWLYVVWNHTEVAKGRTYKGSTQKMVKKWGYQIKGENYFTHYNNCSSYKVAKEFASRGLV